MLQYAMMAGLIQFALHLVKITYFAIGQSLLHHNGAFSMLYGWCDIWGCRSFTNSSPHGDSPIWSKEFKLRFVSPNDLIPLLYCPVFVRLEPFWHCVTFSAVVSWLQFCHIGQVHKSSHRSGCWYFFLTLVQFCCDVWSSRPSFTKAGDSDEIVLCSFCCFWSTSSPTFGCVLSRFLMSPHSVIMLSTKEKKSHLINYSKDYWLY